jgi:hypothetical protein
MTHTDNIVVLSKAIRDKIEANKSSLGINRTFYGDQATLPTTPSLCVEPGEKSRDLSGAPRRTMVSITIYLLLYISHIATEQANREKSDLLAEQLEDFIHQDPYIKDANGEDRVIDSMVTKVEFGYQNKRDSLYKTAMLTIEAKVQTQLPSQFS